MPLTGGWGQFLSPLVGPKVAMSLGGLKAANSLVHRAVSLSGYFLGLRHPSASDDRMVDGSGSCSMKLRRGNPK